MKIFTVPRVARSYALASCLACSATSAEGAEPERADRRCRAAVFNRFSGFVVGYANARLALRDA
ncbi:hypothetical protein IY145_18825 [Methylosinus sp. H3A]|uniref:hypothetical protein n=1 Tax=Methylosinus sp. H3A TaxID=2785786 RepID=UPI0018C240D2|nr:hypothetical protein [Methylosinus sp. H3A]MBG0811408.1 hypothetical protein [Methylosinus sp. H3A]